MHDWPVFHRNDGLTTNAMIAPWVIKGATDGPAFAAYVKKMLVPELAPGTVVIL